MKKVLVFATILCSLFLCTGQVCVLSSANIGEALPTAYSGSTDPFANIAKCETVNSNSPTSITLSSYIRPYLYKNLKDQPILLMLYDQNDDPVSGATITVNENGKTVYTSAKEDEICKGFYRLIVSTQDVPDLRFQASCTLSDSTELKSNVLIVNLRDLSIFNPYIDIKTDYSISPYGKGPSDCVNIIGRKIYDKLPFTVGTAFELDINCWPVSDAKNFFIYKTSTKVEGPVTKIDSNRYFVNCAGKISVTIEMVAWERVNKDCPEWDTTTDISEISTNSAPHIFSKTFDLGEVKTAGFVGINLSGPNAIDVETVEVGKKIDKMVIPIDPSTATKDQDFQTLPFSIIHIFMTNGCNILNGAFTLDTKSSSTVKLSEIWINTLEAKGTAIPDIPIEFSSTSKDIKYQTPWDTLQGITFNYSNGTDCGNHLVIQFFGASRKYSPSGGLSLTYPLVFEVIDPISIIPHTEKKSVTVQINEGQNIVTELLVGVPSTVDINTSKFSFGEPKWRFALNNNSFDCVAAKTEKGYRVSLSKELKEEGKLTIYGYSYNSTCTSKEEVSVSINVRKPDFSVKIGLMDSSIIESDGLVTQGLWERIIVSATDPRGIYKSIYEMDSSMNFSFTAKPKTDEEAGLQSSKVEVKEQPINVENISKGIADLLVIGYDNSNIYLEPFFDLYFVSSGKAEVKICTLKLVEPTVNVEPKEIPYTIPETTTYVTFTVTDAHGHKVPGVGVEVYYFSEPLKIDKTYKVGTTGLNGKVPLCPFSPPFSGRYNVGIEQLSKVPCGWPANKKLAEFEAIYKPPVVDTTPPLVTVAAPDKVSSPEVKITGKATDDVKVISVWIGSKEADLKEDGTFEGIAYLIEGTNIIKVSAYDAANNVTTKTLTIIFEKPKTYTIILKIGVTSFTVNGETRTLDSPPIIKNSRTLLPIRAVVEALGGTVDWISESKAIIITLGTTKIGLQVGNPIAVVNGNTTQIDSTNSKVVPEIINSRTMLPLRFVAENLGCDVQWNDATKTITITYQG